MLQVFCFACETNLSSATLSSSIIIHVKPVVLFFAIKIVLYQLPHVVLNCLLFLDGFIFHVSTSGSQHQVFLATFHNYLKRLNGPQVLGFKAWSMCRKSQSLILPFKKIDHQLHHLSGAFEHNFGPEDGNLNKATFKSSNTGGVAGRGGGVDAQPFLLLRSASQFSSLAATHFLTNYQQLYEFGVS